MKKIKLQKNIPFVLLVGSLVSLSSCVKEKEKNFKIEFRQKDYMSFMINPLDWSYSPDIASLKVGNEKTKKLEMTIEEFEKMIETDEEYIIVEGEKINVKQLREYSEKLLKNITSKEHIFGAKITMIFTESLIILAFGLDILLVPKIKHGQKKTLHR